MLRVGVESEVNTNGRSTLSVQLDKVEAHSSGVGGTYVSRLELDAQSLVLSSSGFKQSLTTCYLLERSMVVL